MAGTVDGSTLPTRCFQERSLPLTTHHSSTLFFFSFSIFQHFITFSYYTLTHTPHTLTLSLVPPCHFLGGCVLSLPLMTAKCGKRAEVPLGLFFSQSPISFIGRTDEESSLRSSTTQGFITLAISCSSKRKKSRQKRTWRKTSVYFFLA